MPNHPLHYDEFTESLAGLSKYHNQRRQCAEYKKRVEVLKRVVDGELTLKQKQCVKLYYYEKKGIAEIADILCVDISTVSRHLQRARRRIQKVMCYYFPKLK